jgi:uridine phosphorylase
MSKLPILSHDDYELPSVFDPKALLREARRQKGLKLEDVPQICLLDPDGDIVRRLRREGKAQIAAGWACYHTELHTFQLGGHPVGIVGFAVGAPFAVLVAEELFACGCQVLISLTSAGQIVPAGPPPYFIVIDRALRDEGTSYHYAAPSEYAMAEPDLVRQALAGMKEAGFAVVSGGTWTTDAPFRETAGAIEAARDRGLLAVEMEAAALYAFASAKRARVLCIAHVTNTMGVSEQDFEKGQADGTADALIILAAIIGRLAVNLAT